MSEHFWTLELVIAYLLPLKLNKAETNENRKTTRTIPKRKSSRIVSFLTLLRSGRANDVPRFAALDFEAWYGHNMVAYEL